MFTLIVTNKRGESLELTHNNNYGIIEIDGLAPGEAVINTSKDVGTDGSVFNSSYKTERPITITMAINYPAEDNRLNLYKYFRTKASCRLDYKNSHRAVWIEAYVERFTVNYFEKKQIAQIILKAPKPHFKGLAQETAELSSVKKLFEFPFSIDDWVEFSRIETASGTIVNPGDIDTGALITLHASGDIYHPVLVDDITGDTFGLDCTLEEGETVVINSIDKEKAVTIYTKEGAELNGAGYITEGSTWPRLQPGTNRWSYTVTGEATQLDVVVQFVPLYEGV